MILRVVFLLSIFCFPIASQAIGNFKPSEAELRLLPKFCSLRATRWGNDIKDPRIQPWYAIYGSDWIHMHHYCKGLDHINKGNGLGAHRVFQYKTAINELSYSLRRAEPRGKESVILPKIYTKIGEAYEGLGNKVSAESFYRKSIHTFPKYLSAYKRLVNMLIRSNRFNEAKVINDKGILLFAKSKFFPRKKQIIEKGLAPE